MIECSIAECRDTIHAEFMGPIEHGFSFKRVDFSYARRRKACIDEFQIELHKMTGWYIVVPSVSAICPEINKLFNTIMSSKNPLNRPTFGFSIDNKFERARGRYHIKDKADFKPVIAAIESDFLEVALPWFSGIQDMRSIDAHINEKDRNGKYNPKSVSHACKGLIAAHLAGNPAFGEMAEAYYKFCCNAQSSALAEPILRTRDYLKPPTLAKISNAGAPP